MERLQSRADREEQEAVVEGMEDDAVGLCCVSGSPETDASFRGKNGKGGWVYYVSEVSLPACEPVAFFTRMRLPS